MAVDWVKVEKTTPRKPEVLRIAAKLGIDPDQAFGLCFRFWCWCDDNLTQSNAAGVTLALVDSLVGRVGFADAMVLAGWLQDDGDSFTVVNFENHLSQSAKARGLTAKRAAKCKTKREKSNADSVTAPLATALPELELELDIKEETHTPPAYAKFDSVPADIAGIEIDGELVTYSQDWIRWEAEFIRRWNSLREVCRHLQHQLDTEERRQLHARFTEPDWYWKRAGPQFPLWTTTGWKPTLMWFLEAGNVNKIIAGKYTRTEEKTNDRTHRSGKSSSRGGPTLGPGQQYVPGSAGQTF